MTFLGNSESLKDDITPRNNYEFDNVARIFDIEKGASNFESAPNINENAEKQESQKSG